jgi:hypothetical protein
MSAKAEIGWKTRAPDGARREVYARRVGGEWLFFVRQRRFEAWQPLPQPLAADWQRLLEAVERRVNRRLLRPEEAESVRRRLREAYPEAPATGTPATGS